MDFACASAKRADLMERVASNPSVVFELCEEFKRSYRNTDKACEGRGFNFTPTVLEAYGGGWSVTARKVHARVAQ